MIGWAFTAKALLELLVNPPVPPSTDDFIVDHDVDDMSFGVGFTQLTTIKKTAQDPWPEVTNVKTWVTDTLNAANVREKGKIATFSKERLAGSPEALQAMAAYMQI